MHCWETDTGVINDSFNSPSGSIRESKGSHGKSKARRKIFAKVVRGGRGKDLQTTKAEKAIGAIGGVSGAPGEGGSIGNNDANLLIFKELFFENSSISQPFFFN